MKKRIPFVIMFAAAMALLSAAALATGPLLSPKASALQLADRAIEKEYGVTAEMMTFFVREEKPLSDGSLRVTYAGIYGLDYVLGTYTATVKDGDVKIEWSNDGKDTSGGYDAKAWGSGQLRQMLEDCRDEGKKEAFMDRSAAIAEKNGGGSFVWHSVKAYRSVNEIDAEKTAAMKARKLPEDEMAAIGLEFIIGNYTLNEEQTARLELYTDTSGNAGNQWYEMVDDVPCFKVEYLLYGPDPDPALRTEMDGYYNVYVNVETGAVEEYEYNSALAGQG